MNWRPKENWRVPFVYEPAMDDVALYSHAEINSVFEAGASAMLAARDKWWVEKIEELTLYSPTGDPDLDLLEELVISYERWQQLKKELSTK